MKRTYRKYVATIPVLAACVIAACAPMTEAELEKREIARLEFREQFVAHRAACNASGGRILVDGWAEFDRDGVPEHRVYYVCEMGPDFVARR